MLWDDFSVFLAIHRAGNHSGAARALRVDPTTIGRRIEALQKAVGSVLFERTPGGLRLTESGALLLPRAERIEAEVTAAELELRGTDARLAGTVRLTASDGIVDYVLLPRLAELRRMHPELEVELNADARNVDLSRREADVAVRLSRPKEPALVARRLGTLRFALFASATYLEKRGTPRSAAELAGHDWIEFDIGAALPQTKWLGKVVANRKHSVRVNTTAASVAACGAGLGLALLPVFAGAGLRPVLPRLAGPTRELWAVSHRDVRRMARVVAVTSWLADAFDSGAL